MDLIDPNTELKAIIDYLSKTWDGLDEQSITQVWNSGLHASRNALDQYGFNDFSRELIENDISYLINGQPLFVSKLIFAVTDLYSFDREQYMNKEYETIKHMSSLIPSDARPKDWEQIYELYHYREDYEAYYEGLPKVEFKGTNFRFESTFEEVTNLAHVMYYDKEQGYSPSESLFSAIVSQARYLQKENNATLMVKEWEDQVKNTTTSELQFKEPLNLALLSFINAPNKTVHPEIYAILGMNDKATKKIKP